MTIEFMDWSRPLLSQAIQRLIPADSAGRSVDLSRDMVVLPGGRAMRRFEEILVERATELGAILTPPRLTTIGQLPELIFERDRPIASGAALMSAWAEAARSEPADRMGLLYGRLPEARALASWTRIGRQLHALHREVARGGLLLPAALELMRGDERERWAVLCALQEKALRRLESAGLLDPDAARIAAVEEGRISAPGTIWLVGTPEIPGVTHRMLEQIRDRVRVIVHAPEAERESFNPMGGVREESWLDRSIELAADQIHFADNPAGQADAVVSILHSESTETRGLGVEDIVIGVLDADVVPSLQERIAETGLVARDAAGRPLAQSAPYRLLQSTATLLNGLRWEAFASWVRHPDVDRVRRGTEVERTEEAPDAPAVFTLDEVDRWYERSLPVRVSFDEVPVDGALQRPLHARVGDFARGLLGDLRAAEDERPISEWVEPVLEYLARVYDTLELDDAQVEDRALIRALGIIGFQLQQWRKLPHLLAPRCSAGVALGLMLEAIPGVEIPHPARRDAIDLLGWLELQLDDAPIAIVTGVSSSTLPESVDSGPFLTDALRDRLGLGTGAARRARDTYRLLALSHSRRKLHLVTGRATSQGDPIRPSPLLLSAGSRTEMARRVLRFYDGAVENGAVDGTASSNDAAAESRVTGFRSPPHSRLHFEVPESLAATDFSRILQDPYRFVLERVERLREINDRARELDGAQFGDLAHRVLERFGSTPAAASDDPAVVCAELDSILDNEVGQRFGAGAWRAQVTVRLQAEQLRSRLRRLAQWQADRVARGWRIHGVEIAFGEADAPMMVDGQPMGIRAKIDRIDHHPETGHWIVWDYKTSDPGRLPDATHLAGPRGDKRWVDLQLPLYRWLARQLIGDDGAPLIPAGDSLEVGYILLPRDLTKVDGVVAEWSTDQFEEAMSVAHEAVRTVRSGTVEFESSLRSPWATPALDGLLGHRQLTLTADAEDDP